MKPARLVSNVVVPALLLGGLVVAGMGGRPDSTGLGRAEPGPAQNAAERRIPEQRVRTARGVTLAGHEIGYVPSVFGYLGSTTEKVELPVGPHRNRSPNAAGPSVSALQSTAEFGEKTTSAADYDDGPIGYIVVTVIQAEDPAQAAVMATAHRSESAADPSATTFATQLGRARMSSTDRYWRTVDILTTEESIVQVHGQDVSSAELRAIAESIRRVHA